MDNEMIRRARRSGTALFDWLVWAWDSWIVPVFMMALILRLLANQKPDFQLNFGDCLLPADRFRSCQSRA